MEQDTIKSADGSATPFFAFMENFPFGCAMIDANKQVLFANKFLFGSLCLGVQPKTLEELAANFKNFNVTALYERAIETKSVAEANTVPVNDKIFRLYAVPMLHDVQLIGGMIIVEDMTADKEAESRKDEFLAVASHELRMPLVAIKDNAELMIQHYFNQLPNKDMQEMITDIDKASTRLIGIVNNFLDISKAEDGKINFTREIFSLPDAVNEAFSSLHELAVKKQLTLTSSFPSDLPKISADKDRVQQVLVNLIGNGIKYAEKGSIIVSARMKENQIQVEVADTGVGIPEEFRDHLFKKFKQATGIELAHQISEGSGLGLYISKILVENMGGMIWLEKSIAGEGSTFAFTLPSAMV